MFHDTNRRVRVYDSSVLRHPTSTTTPCVQSLVITQQHSNSRCEAVPLAQYPTAYGLALCLTVHALYDGECAPAARQSATVCNRCASVSESETSETEMFKYSKLGGVRIHQSYAEAAARLDN